MSQSYEGLEAEWHDLFWAAEDAPSELPLMEEFLKEVEGNSLYVGSGSGRLLGPLVEKGHTVAGLESSSEMVALSRERWPKAEVKQGLWEDETDSKKALLLPGFTFQLFENPRRELQRMADLVGEGGRAYVSLFFPWAELSGDLPAAKWYPDRELDLLDGKKGEMRTKHVILEKKSLLKREHEYTLRSADGEVLKQERRKQSVRFFVDTELNKMLKKTGWKVTKETYDFGEHDGDTVYVTTLFLKQG